MYIIRGLRTKRKGQTRSDSTFCTLESVPDRPWSRDEETSARLATRY